MKNISLILLLSIFFAFTTCKKEETPIPPDFILAGQKSGEGVHYHDFTPDILLDPSGYPGNEEEYDLDINGNTTTDITFYGYQATYGHAGYGSATKAIALDSVWICVDADSLDWAETLAFDDTIKTTSTWNTGETLLHNYFEDHVQGGTTLTGLWYGQTNKYLGFRIKTVDTELLGWIQLKISLSGQIAIYEYAYLTK